MSNESTNVQTEAQMGRHSLAKATQPMKTSGSWAERPSKQAPREGGS